MSDPAAALPDWPRPVPYPEKLVRPLGPAEAALSDAQGLVVAALARSRGRRLARIVAKVASYQAEADRLDPEAFTLRVAGMRRRLRSRADLRFADIAQSFALVRAASGRVLGMRHFDCQLIGGYALLRGMVAEMDTGEGKTLTATLAVVTAALAGIPVHVVTVNDYLARRDAETLRPLYSFLGLSVSVVVEVLPREARRAAYAADISYVTNKELAFDYLRDRLAAGRDSSNLLAKMGVLFAPAGAREARVLRGLHFAIVDEIDSILIDEARTPLILSREAEADGEAAQFRLALAIAERLRPDADFTIDRGERRAELTASGLARLDELLPLSGPWRNRVYRQDLVTQALVAIHLMRADDHYIVRDGKARIVDEYTGRVMADRFWSDGLHQMIEIKEGLEPSTKRLTLARMTYQRFFRRYRRLSGMSGTGLEVARELWAVYRLPVARIPPHRPSRRNVMRSRMLPTLEVKWRAITFYAAHWRARGIPVLIGTRSVAASQHASDHLAAAGLDHVLLNAAQDDAEAAIVAAAGHPGRITVATNMAGRGTDIRIAAEVAERGGLHVIMSEAHDSARIDRQLAGRCARQGEPGVFVALMSLDDPLLAATASRSWMVLVRFGTRVFGETFGRWAMHRAQRNAERLHAKMRRQLLRSDETLDHALAFSGRAE